MKLPAASNGVSEERKANFILFFEKKLIPSLEKKGYIENATQGSGELDPLWIKQKFNNLYLV